MPIGRQIKSALPVPRNPTVDFIAVDDGGDPLTAAELRIETGAGHKILETTDRDGQATVTFPSGTDEIAVTVRHPRFTDVEIDGSIDELESEDPVEARFTDELFTDWCDHLEFSRRAASEKYGEYGINHAYHDPDSYDAEDSFFGNGRYPPDWDNRRTLVADLQNNTCARCRTARSQCDAYMVAHVLPVSNGGNHRLPNLIGLCCNCHAMKYPQMNDHPGNWYNAPQFPRPEAPDVVAVARTHHTPAPGIGGVPLEPVTPQTALDEEDGWEALGEQRFWFSDSEAYRTSRVDIRPDEARLGTMSLQAFKHHFDITTQLSEIITFYSTASFALTASLTAVFLGLLPTVVAGPELAKQIAPITIGLAVLIALGFVGKMASAAKYGETTKSEVKAKTPPKISK